MARIPNAITTVFLHIRMATIANSPSVSAMAWWRSLSDRDTFSGTVDPVWVAGIKGERQMLQVQVRNCYSASSAPIREANPGTNNKYY